MPTYLSTDAEEAGAIAQSQGESKRVMGGDAEEDMLTQEGYIREILLVSNPKHLYTKAFQPCTKVPHLIRKMGR